MPPGRPPKTQSQGDEPFDPCKGIARYDGSNKHGKYDRPGANRRPTNGQEALDNSVRVKPTSARRVGVDPKTGEIVVFDETHPDKCVFHGHVRRWDELEPEMKKALEKAGMTTGKGKIINGLPVPAGPQHDSPNKRPSMWDRLNDYLERLMRPPLISPQDEVI